MSAEVLQTFMSGIRPSFDIPSRQSNLDSEERAVTKVRRNLFGPVNHEENLKHVQDEILKIAESDSKKWGFDFMTGKPLDGQFSWELAIPSKIPKAYDMVNLVRRLNCDAAAFPLSDAADIPQCFEGKLLAKVDGSKISDKASAGERSQRNGPAICNPLLSSITSVTTATATITSILPIKVKTHLESMEPFKGDCDQLIELSRPTLKLKRKSRKRRSCQSSITDYLTVRKRKHSPSRKTIPELPVKSTHLETTSC